MDGGSLVLFLGLFIASPWKFFCHRPWFHIILILSFLPYFLLNSLEDRIDKNLNRSYSFCSESCSRCSSYSWYLYETIISEYYSRKLGHGFQSSGSGINWQIFPKFSFKLCAFMKTYIRVEHIKMHFTKLLKM